MFTLDVREAELEDLLDRDDPLTAGHRGGQAVEERGLSGLCPGRSVKVHTGSGRNSRTDRYWKQDFYVWNNDGGEPAAITSRPSAD